MKLYIISCFYFFFPEIIFFLFLQSDLVGFREENVLQVSGFYKADVQFNYLAELMTDKSMAVKEEIVQMLLELMTEIGDRYDHQTRLLIHFLISLLCYLSINLLFNIIIILNIYLLNVILILFQLLLL